MADGVSSPLTFRDFIRHLLPTATALCLFLPLFRIPNNKLEVAAVVFAAVVLGYLVTTPLSDFLTVYYGCTPIMKIFKRRREWMASNWDYDKLFYSLSQEEREYVYVTLGYTELYRQLSFYLLIYAAVNLFLLLNAVHDAFDVNSFFVKVVDARTTVVGGLLLPTWILFILSLLTAFYSFKDFLNEFMILFHESGQYSIFAERVHEKDGGFARLISGVVRGWALPDPKKKKKKKEEKKAWAGAQVTLQDANGKELDTKRTDLEGYFSFDNPKNKYPAGAYKLVIAGGEPKSISVADKTVPFFRVELLQTVPEPKLKHTRPMTFLMIVIGLVFILDLFAAPDWFLRTLYFLSLLPYIAFICIFKCKPSRLDSPFLSASLILSVALVVTGLWHSISNFALLEVKPGLRWTNLVLPFLTQRWYEVAILIGVVSLLCLVRLNDFEQTDTVSDFQKVARLPKLNPQGITFNPTPVVDPIAPQEYVMSLAGEDLHDMALTVPENLVGQIEILTKPEIDPEGRTAQVRIRIAPARSPAKYVLSFKVEAPTLTVPLDPQPPPASLKLLYRADEKAKPPVVSAAEQQIPIVISGKNLNGATLTITPPLTISNLENELPDKLEAVVTIPANTPPKDDYAIGVKNTNEQTANVSFVIKTS